MEMDELDQKNPRFEECALDELRKVIYAVLIAIRFPHFGPHAPSDSYLPLSYNTCSHPCGMGDPLKLSGGL